MTPDVNVLVAASRSDHPHHAAARTWLEQALVDANQGAALKLQPMVIASFLRLVTHPKIFVHPTPVSEALRFVDALLAAPSVERPELGAEWPVLRKLCIDHSLAANDIPDAWLALRPFTRVNTWQVSTATSSACFRELSSPCCLRNRPS